jgi:uncharacterized protein (DUF433 family)
MGERIIKLSHRIISDPRIQGGEPCFAGTRIMVRSILDLLEAGYTSWKVVEDWGHQFTEEDIKEAVSIRRAVVEVSDEVRAHAEARIARELCAAGIVEAETAHVKV